MTDSSEKLLLNYWYAGPMGHAIEGLRYALGYQAANPGLRTSLLLSGATAIDLARRAPFLDGVFSVPFTSFDHVAGDPAAALAAVPREWDYVVDNERVAQPAQHQFAGFRAFFEASHRHFAPRHGFGLAGQEPPAYLPHQDLRLDLPAQARAAARATIGEGRPAIAFVLAGSSAHRHLYPSTTSWQLILTEIARRYPDAALCLIGKLDQDGRTTTSMGRSELERLLRKVPSAVDCFDRPLMEQLALVEASDLLVSPHTGFSFAASMVETPWLAISGGNWHEYFFNGVPVYSLLPDTERYPCFAWAELGSKPLPVIAADSDGEGPRTPSMSLARILDDLSRLLEAADLLIEGRLGYEEALADYFPRLLKAYEGDRSRIFSFDDIHEQYLPPVRGRATVVPAGREPRVLYHVGCGDQRLDGYVNVDVRQTPATDVVADLNEIDLPLPASGFFSNAFFEHLMRAARVPHLRGARRMLDEDGFVCYIGLPDFRSVAENYLSGAPGIVGEKFDLYNVYRYTHGDPEGVDYYFEQLHKSLFDREEVDRLLTQAGFPSHVTFTYVYPGEQARVTMGFFAAASETLTERLIERATEVLRPFDGRFLLCDTVCFAEAAAQNGVAR